MIPERLRERDFLTRSVVTTMDGAEVRMSLVNGKPRLAGSRILFGDVIGSNGIAHMIAPALTVQQQPASTIDPYDPLGLPASHPNLPVKKALVPER